MGRVPVWPENTERNLRKGRYPEKELRKLFKKCDTNGDGKLSKTELKEAFNKLGALVPGFRAWQGMANADGNGDGYVDLDNTELDDLIKFAFSLGYTFKK